ncbi:hypothetical protein DMQ72_10560 [Klebsiella quasipneumoniae]|nr:hypothetical protein [Klebsiella quasipneumoniae]RXY95162.1 hypothetical protein DD571_28270 [Klebsiella pneumoniae]PXH97006.1 hypothetical protein DMQ72_10560 [Klebsiella quasipneumoniae]TYE06721.1 hypothetical protein DJ500_22005 [Klebsiella pneumoniae]TYE16943.1 hypothetical protein DJ510_22115 [Klebsiella pneumoniae]
MVILVLAHHMQALSAFQPRSERYTVILIRCDRSDNLMKSLRSACCCITNGALWLLFISFQETLYPAG